MESRLPRERERDPRMILRDSLFLPRAHGRVPHPVSPHPRHAAPVKSPRKARRDHNSVYLRPTVVVSEGFRNLSVALGNFRAAGGGDGGTAPVKSASVARLASRRATIDRRAIRKGREENAGILFRRNTRAKIPPTIVEINRPRWTLHWPRQSVIRWTVH